MPDPVCVKDWIKELFDEQSDHISNHSRGPLEKAATEKVSDRVRKLMDAHNEKMARLFNIKLTSLMHHTDYIVEDNICRGIGAKKRRCTRRQSSNGYCQTHMSQYVPPPREYTQLPEHTVQCVPCPPDTSDVAPMFRSMLASTHRAA